METVTTAGAELELNNMTVLVPVDANDGAGVVAAILLDVDVLVDMLPVITTSVFVVLVVLTGATIAIEIDVEVVGCARI